VGNGLIIAFVVAVWAAYFVPLALRRYDEASKTSSVESFSSRSRVISRPSAAAPAEPEGEAPVEAPARKPAPVSGRAARVAAQRRRRTLLTLLALLAVVGGVAGFGVISPWWVAAPVGLVVAWLVACRVQVRSERGISRVREPRAPRAEKAPKEPKASKGLRLPKVPTLSKLGSAKPAPGPTAADEEETIIVSGQFEDINPGRKHQMENVPLEADALDDKIVIAVPSISTTGDALWDPLPVTLPTYVTKPRAGRTVRTIEFGQPGAWTSGHIEGEDVELPHRADDAGDDRRAVGH
jgi:hypothetical protein